MTDLTQIIQGLKDIETDLMIHQQQGEEIRERAYKMRRSLEQLDKAVPAPRGVDASTHAAVIRTLSKNVTRRVKKAL